MRVSERGKKRGREGEREGVGKKGRVEGRKGANE